MENFVKEIDKFYIYNNNDIKTYNFHMQESYI